MSNYKYYLLSFFIGCVTKTYDDLNDNIFLFDYLNLAKYKEYINEILKMLFGIGFTILSLQNYLFFLIFITINLEAYLMCKEDYSIYELSGLIAAVLLIPFINNLVDIKINDVLIIILTILWFFGFEYCSNIINEEYSYKKLIQRSGAFIVLTSLFFINNKFKFVTPNLNNIFLFVGGYAGVSTIFQCIMLNKKAKEDKLALLQQEKQEHVPQSEEEHAPPSDQDKTEAIVH